MNNTKNKKVLKYIYFSGLLFIIVGLISFVFVNFNIKTAKISDANLQKVAPVASMAKLYEAIESKVLSPVHYDTVDEAIKHAKYFPVSFTGILTHYGPDCDLCGGHLGCNGQDARNGNIYYNDKEYGKVRIVATSRDIPCGSMLIIHVDKYDPNGMLAIVLDRGVSGRVIDLLKESQSSDAPVGTTHNVVFDIIRNGY